MRSDDWKDHFDPRILAVPALAFVGGAVLGRVLGLKGLMRGAMAALALGTAGRRFFDEPERVVRSRAKPIRRAAHKRSAQKRSPARSRG